jgi:dTDP-4-amino-4,6-dideoxygalactose transaminase
MTELIEQTSSKRHEGVPFVDLRAAGETLEPAILEDVTTLMRTGAFINGPAVAEFEQAFAAACGRGICVGVSSGLDGLRLALCTLDLRPGDEVLVPAMTFIATFEAVVQAGGTPVVVDVREDDVAMDPAAVAAAVGPRTRALLPVHLYGQMADVRALRVTAERHELELIEDACQAHGAERDGIGAGAAGRMAAFSFYPSKNLGGFGDAGAVVLDDERLAAQIRALRQHGETSKYRSEYIGYTARLDTIQALVLARKLPLLDGWNAQRRRAAELYSAGLAGVGDLRLPETVAGASHVWHVYSVRTADPGALGEFLGLRGIGSGRHYPEAPHLSAAFRHLGYREGSFPVAEAVARETLSLPIFPGITDRQVETVVEAVSGFFARG